MELKNEFDYGMTEYAMEEQDLESYTVWIWDGAHQLPAFPPLALNVHLDSANDAIQYGAEMLSCPGTKGWAWRVLNGHSYLAVIEPKPEEVPAREKLFRERMMPFVEDPIGSWAKASEEMMRSYEHIQQVDIEKVSLLELKELFYEAIRVHKRMWELHFEWMYPLFVLDSLFFTLCEELTGIKRDNPIHAKLRSGFNNMLFKADRELWLLGRKTAEMGLRDLFLTTADDEKLMSELEASEAGRKWLKQYQEFVNVYGWRCERIQDCSTPSWIEKPSLGLRAIGPAVAKGGDYPLDAERERLTREREQARKELLAKVPRDQREWFEKLLGVAQISGFWSEDHNHYCDYPGSAVPRKVFVEVGNRFARAGIIDEPFDVFMLLPREVSKAIIPLERTSYRQLARARKKDWERVRLKPPPTFLGNVEKLGEMIGKDPVLAVLAAPPVVRPELKADLYGAASAPGVAEGIARVIMNEASLGEVEPGEILVAPFTLPPWIPIFNIVRGVVTDLGGALAHAVIVGREYGLPVVAGTLEATTKIKTGDRIRVDGNMGAVYILSKQR